MAIQNHVEVKLCCQKQERDQLGWIFGLFRRKKRSSQEVDDEHKPSEDSPLMRRNKATNLHLFLCETMKKLKHAIRKEKPRVDKRFFEKKKSFEKSLSTKDHFFLERMTSVSPKRSHQEHYENEKHLPKRLNNGEFDPNSGKQVQRRIALLPEYLSPFSSPGRIWDQDITVLSRSASYNFMKSEMIADDFIIKETETASSREDSSNNQIVDEMSKVEAYGEERLSLVSVASESHYISRTEENELVLEPLFIEYDINPAIVTKSEAKIRTLSNQFQYTNHAMDAKESVFKYVKAVLDATDLNWEELYLKTEFSDQLLTPALISNIPFYPNQLCVDHELLFDCINEVLFELCRFPQWVSFVKPRAQVLSLSVESNVSEVQEKVYRHLLPMQLPESVDHIVREDMARRRSWMETRCDIECIGFETSDLILDELLEELKLDL